MPANVFPLMHTQINNEELSMNFLDKVAGGWIYTVPGKNEGTVDCGHCGAPWYSGHNCEGMNV